MKKLNGYVNTRILVEDGFHYTATDRSLNLAKLKWQDSKTCHGLHNILLQNNLALKAIRKIVCVGLGTIKPNEYSYLAPIMQLACLLDLAKIVKEQTDGIAPKVLAQDPAFDKDDQRLLQDNGVTVVEDPAIWRHVDDHCLVFAPHFPVKHASDYMLHGQFRRGKGMAMYIGYRLDQTWHKTYDKEQARLYENMKNRYKSHDLYYPKDPAERFPLILALYSRESFVRDVYLHHAFQDTTLYFRDDLVGRDENAR